MVRAILLGGAFAFAVATSASAAGFTPIPLDHGNNLVINVAEGCGPGYWRGPAGRCHPLAMHRACPPGYHLGPEGKKCWPN